MTACLRGDYVYLHSILFSRALAKMQRTSVEVSSITLGLHWLTEVRIQSKFLSTEKTLKFFFSYNAIMRKNDISNFQWLMFVFFCFQILFYPLLAVLSVLFSPSHLYLKFHPFSLIHVWMSSGRQQNHDALMQVFGQLQSYVLSSLQQSLVAGFEWHHALHTGFECSLVGSRSLVLLGGWAWGICL